ncbi:MAG: phenylalanine--tRNA ligase subunit beta [Gemmatimonadaceae bacterium]
MNASFEWLKDFTEFDLTPRELRDIITARAATVDDVVALRQDLKDIVVGRVVSAASHPDSDHLWITKVDAGAADLLDVVCGAPNVQQGVKYPFAPVGAVLPGGLKIERRKIRGQSSTGMLCSARELGLGLDHDGILALDTAAAPGTPFLAAYAAGDTRLVIDVLPNRPDLLAHEGVAREIAAFTGNSLIRPSPAGMVMPDVPFTHASNSATTGSVKVSVDGNAACSLYIAVVIRGVTVAPSPDWLASRLAGAGARSINNVVDATNYMLHGFGQPMHAFDLGTLAGPEIQVRRAYDGESITTLDGVARKLDPSMIVIADAARAQAVAGVIGGQGSEVTDSTTDILLEVAVFDPRSVRRTRRALGVSTDASYRFERAMDAAAAEGLARYAAGLICALASGVVDGAPLTIGTPPAPTAPVTLRLSRVARVLGETVSGAECAALLASVGFEVTAAQDDATGNTIGKTTGDILQVSPPTWRADVTAEADLMEEIARLRGYDSFPDELRPFRVGGAADSPAYTVTRRVTRALVKAGLYEVRPTPFVADAGADGVSVSNPLAESEAMLRSSVLQTLARRVEHNFAHMSRNVRLFEVGVAFARGDGPIPVEQTVAAAVITGERFPAHFADPKPPPVDLWDARQIADELVSAAYGGGQGVDFAPNSAGDGWVIARGGTAIGSVGPLVVDAPAWASLVFGVELDITPAMGASLAGRTYVPLPSTPAAEFDLALVLPVGVLAADVQRVITNTAGELLESLIPFDEFTGNGVPDGYRSVAWHLGFRHPERTLRDKEIEGRRGRILRSLEEELGVHPRTS